MGDRWQSGQLQQEPPVPGAQIRRRREVAGADRAQIPGIRGSIKTMEVATPVTNVRYSLNPGGSIYGSEQTVENMYLGRLSPMTPIPNLFLAGAWTMGGGMSAALLAGQSAAQRVQRAMSGEPATAEAASNQTGGSAIRDARRQ